jgi:glycosyltransferase involved in cell wall biosynthesis
VARTVLFLHSSAGLYGADRQLLTLASGLDRSRFTPVAVLPEQGPLAPLLEKAGVKLEFQPLAVLRRTLASPGGAASTVARVARDRMALGRLAKRHSAALIHSNTSVVLAGGPAARRAGVPHVVHVREIYEGAAGKGAEALWPKLRDRIQEADALVCISDAVAAQFPGAGNVHVIRDCLAREPVTSVGAVVRKAMKIENHAFVVALIGRISDWKGQDVLARALAEPALKELGAVGLVIGDAYPGHEQAETDLAALAQELGLGDRLRLLGFRDDIGTLLGASDAVAIPSVRPEPLGQVALEAAWAGLPVVGTAHGGLPEVVRDGETGLLVPPGDHEALARALRELADDRERAKALGEAGSRAIRDSGGCAQMLTEIQALYERLAPVQRRRGL